LVSFKIISYEIFAAIRILVEITSRRLITGIPVNQISVQ